VLYEKSYYYSSIEYSYEENIYGIKSASYYGFYKGFFGLRLFAFSAEIPVADEAEGRELFYKIYEHMTEVYGEKTSIFNYELDDYHNDGVIENAKDDEMLSASFSVGPHFYSRNARIYLLENYLQIHVYLHC